MSTEDDKSESKKKDSDQEETEQDQKEKNKEKTDDPEVKEKEEKTTEKTDCYRYEGDVCVYTDPTTKQEFVLNESQTEWIPRTTPSDNYKFDGTTYGYTDAQGNKFKWNLEKEEWEKVVSESSESEEDDETTDEQRRERRYRKRKAQPGWNTGSYTTDPETGVQLYKDPSDGMVYEWDSTKSAWFPKIDEDFLAQYQMNYGFTKDGKAEPTRPADSTTTTTTTTEKLEKAEKEEEEDKKPKNEKDRPQWFEEDPQNSRKVYVSGLPETINEEKFIALMTKCGIIETDPRNDNKPRVKVYRDENGVPKGDALCTYAMVESVTLALQILDESYIDDKHKISVSHAKFQMKGGAYDPSLKPKKLRKKELERVKKRKEKVLAWDLDAVRGVMVRNKRDKVIVVTNLFDPRDFHGENASKILDVSDRLRTACEKFGTVRKVEIYDRHQDGVAQVFFSTPVEADLAIEMLNGRLFGNNVMKAFTWDGKTKYKIDETPEEEQERLATWDTFLEAESDDENNKKDSTVEEKESKESGDVE